MHEPQEVLGMVCMAHQHAPEVLQPSEQPFHLPATLIPPPGAAVLSVRPFAVRSAGRDQLDPDGREGHVEGGAIVGLITEQPCGALGGNARRESVWDQGGFRRRSSRLWTATGRPARSAPAMSFVPLPRVAVPTPGPPVLPRPRCRR
jgi:hypothetical protein